LACITAPGDRVRPGDFPPEVLRPVRAAPRFEVDRLGQEVVGAEAHGADGVRDAAVAGEQDHRHGRSAAAHRLEQLQAAEVRHAQVGQDGAVRPCGQGAQGLAAVADAVHADAGVGLEQAAELAARGIAVVGEEQPRRGRPLDVSHPSVFARWHRHSSLKARPSLSVRHAPARNGFGTATLPESSQGSVVNGPRCPAGGNRDEEGIGGPPVKSGPPNTV
jgi:hypothetical protein